MQMPRLSLPRFSLGALGSLGDRSWLWYSLYTTVLFLVFLVATFPHEILIRRAISQAPQGQVVFDFDDARFAWYRGIELSGVRVSDATGVVALPYLEVTRLWARPVFSDLIRGDWSSVNLDGEIYGGQGHGLIRIHQGIVSGDVQLTGLSLGRSPLLRSFLEEGTLGGRVNAAIRFEAAGIDVSAVKASGEISLAGGSLEGAKIGGFGVPNLHLADARLDAELQDERLDIKGFSAHGKEIVVDASGQVALREPIDRSILNIKTVVEAGSEAPDSIKGLLSLIPKPPPGSPDKSIRITGTLAKPKMG